MKSIYNNQAFFEEYSKMSRSSQGLEGAGEWYLLEPLFPELSHKSVSILAAVMAGTVLMPQKKAQIEFLELISVRK